MNAFILFAVDALADSNSQNHCIALLKCCNWHVHTHHKRKWAVSDGNKYDTQFDHGDCLQLMCKNTMVYTSNVCNFTCQFYIVKNGCWELIFQLVLTISFCCYVHISVLSEEIEKPQRRKYPRCMSIILSVLCDHILSCQNFLFNF